MDILYALNVLIAVTQAAQFLKYVPVHAKINAGQIECKCKIISITYPDYLWKSQSYPTDHILTLQHLN